MALVFFSQKNPRNLLRGQKLLCSVFSVVYHKKVSPLHCYGSESLCSDLDPVSTFLLLNFFYIFVQLKLRLLCFILNFLAFQLQYVSCNLKNVQYRYSKCLCFKNSYSIYQVYFSFYMTFFRQIRQKCLNPQHWSTPPSSELGYLHSSLSLKQSRPTSLILLQFKNYLFKAELNPPKNLDYSYCIINFFYAALTFTYCTAEVPIGFLQEYFLF